MLFFQLPLTCLFDSRPNTHSKIARNAGGTHFLLFNAKTIKYSAPHFLFRDFDSNHSFFPMLGIFGNSMTSGEGIWITHC